MTFLLALFLAMPTLPQRAASATDPSPRGDDAWMRDHDRIVAEIRSREPALLFIGDSITAAWTSDRGGRAVWGRYYAPRRAVNLGVASDRTQHVLWRLDHGEVDGIRPKVAVVMIGTNNLGANTTDEVVAGIRAVVEDLRRRLPTTKVLLLGLLPRGESPGPIRDEVKAVNDRIKGLDDGRFVLYRDLGPTFLGPDGTISRALMYDFLHPTPRGYRLWADAIEPTLWALLEGK